MLGFMDEVSTSSRDVALPEGYGELLAELKATVAATRWRAQRVVNTELVSMYWKIGRAILARQQAQEWGTAVVEQLSRDLREEFPKVSGFSRSNLFYMRSFA